MAARSSQIDQMVVSPLESQKEFIQEIISQESRAPNANPRGQAPRTF